MLINKNGILVETKNIQQIVEAIERLYLEKQFAKGLSDEAYKTIGNFSKEMMCERYQKLYSELG